MPDTQMFGTDKEWRALKAYQKRLATKYAKLTLKMDSGQALDDWEADREMLAWTVERTPVVTAFGLRTKLRIVQFFAAPGPSRMNSGRVSELASEIARDVLALGKAA